MGQQNDSAGSNTSESNSSDNYRIEFDDYNAIKEKSNASQRPMGLTEYALSKLQRQQAIDNHNKSLNMFRGNQMIEEKRTFGYSTVASNASKWKYDEDEENTPLQNQEVELKPMSLETAAGNTNIEVKESPMQNHYISTNSARASTKYHQTYSSIHDMPHQASKFIKPEDENLNLDEMFEQAEKASTAKSIADRKTADI
jgi:hypothetical protein